MKNIFLRYCSDVFILPNSVRASQRNKLNAGKRYDIRPVFVLCSCGRCPSCKFRQSPEERLRQHLSEVNGHTFSDIPSTLDLRQHFAIGAVGRRLASPGLSDDTKSDVGR